MPGVWDAPLFAFPSMNLTQDQYRELLKDLPAAVYVCDAEGKIVFYNDAAVSLWGRTPSLGEEKWCGSSHMRHADGSEIPKEAGPMALAVKNGIALENMEILVERNDGTTRFVSAQPRPIFDEERRVVGGITLLADITDRKAAENAVKESDKRKDEFLGVLAHELRNPLAPLRTGLQLIRLAPNDTNTVENALEVMDRQLQQMVRLIDDLLDVSRISRGKIELHREPVEITSVLKSALEASQPLIEAAGHELNVFTPSEEVFVDADVTRLAQVFSNLLSNAAKYTPKGGHLTLEVTPTRDQIKVSLKDDGVGIPSQMLSKVFDMFTQVDASLDRITGWPGYRAHTGEKPGGNAQWNRGSTEQRARPWNGICGHIAKKCRFGRKCPGHQDSEAIPARRASHPDCRRQQGCRTKHGNDAASRRTRNADGARRGANAACRHGVSSKSHSSRPGNAQTKRL
jgi:PAS domain S-box-containing protein